MVGQAVLRECLLDAEVDHNSRHRRTPSQEHPKLRELVPTDFSDFSHRRTAAHGLRRLLLLPGRLLRGNGRSRNTPTSPTTSRWRRPTLARLNPNMTFLYVSGAGTDRTERVAVPCGPASKARPRTTSSSSRSGRHTCSAGIHSADARHPFKDPALPVLLHHPQSHPPPPQKSLPPIHHHDRAARSRHDSGRQTRLPSTHPRIKRHRYPLTRESHQWVIVGSTVQARHLDRSFAKSGPLTTLIKTADGEIELERIYYVQFA